MSTLSIDGISKQYFGRPVLSDVRFEARAGEMLGLIGPNGSGKTTVLECLAGLIPCDGAVRSGGSVVLPRDRKRVLYYMPDGIVPWPAQSVRWTLRFFEELYERPGGEGERIAGALGLGALLQSHAGTLSKGERKRLLLALGLLTPQPALLLDEPFDGLDLRQTRDATEVLRIHAAKGRSMLLSIHQLNDAARICDRLALLSAGRIVGVGGLEELRQQSGVSGGVEEIFLALT